MPVQGKYRKERKTVVHNNPININFLSIFAIFYSTKSVEDNWLLCIYTCNLWKQPIFKTPTSVVTHPILRKWIEFNVGSIPTESTSN